MMNGKSILTCLLILCGILGLLLFNSDNIYTELTFSKDSGFYEEPFELEIYAPPGTEVFYTLDGSDPDENAIQYTGPIRIDDATYNDNVYSMRTDMSAGFLTDNITYYGLYDPHYVVPNYPVDKCTIIKSVYRDVDGNFSEIKTQSYFVGYDEKTAYDNLNIMSIVTNPDNLFDYDTGIYVLGQIYDEFASSEKQLKDPNPNWWWWNANYRQSGYEWERIANIKLFDTERNLLLDKTCGIRIQGGGSRGRLPKSMNLYAREQYDNEERFGIDLFNTNYMAHRVTLFAGGDDSIAKLRDMLMAELTGGRNFSTMRFVPYALFLDGEYWGVYWLTEKYDDVYIGHYYDVDKDNVIMIKNSVPEEGEEHYNLYTEMIDYMSNTDLTVDGNYYYACELIDMQSYIDYYASEIYIGRYGDWPIGNEALWRVHETGDTRYEDGKWRWMLFDVNTSNCALSSDLIEKDTFLFAMNRSKMFYNLCQNDNFKKQFTVTFMDFVNTSFTNENVDTIISNYIDLMKEPMNMDNKRFLGSENSYDFLDAVADVQNFLDNRRPYIVQYLKDDFGLSGVLAPVKIEISDPAAGSIVLNTIEPSFDTDRKWIGEYYTDYPITLAATANEGYRFVGWEIIDSPSPSQKENLTENTIVTDISEQGISIKAVFEKTDNFKWVLSHLLSNIRQLF